MPKQSAGLLIYRQAPQLEVLLMHPGGPFWSKKDKGVWSIPKGEFTDEEPLVAAKREFGEETGWQPPRDDGENFTALDSVKLSSGKTIYAWAVAGDYEVASLVSNTFKMEWPPLSGEQEFPEVDKAAWFTLERAYVKLHPSQRPFLDRLSEQLGTDYKPPEQASLF